MAGNDIKLTLSHNTLLASIKILHGLHQLIPVYKYNFKIFYHIAYKFYVFITLKKKSDA